jgi:hypothetical protein
MLTKPGCYSSAFLFSTFSYYHQHILETIIRGKIIMLLMNGNRLLFQ